MTGLSVGRHTAQLVAEMETDDLTLKSESIHIDLLKAGTGAPFIGLKLIHADGHVLGRDEHLEPVLEPAATRSSLSTGWPMIPTVCPLKWSSGKTASRAVP